MNRRTMLKMMLAAGVAPMFAPSRLFGQESPSKQVTLGFIGVGTHGTSVNLQNFLSESDARVLAVCDVKGSHAAQAKRLVDARYGNKDCACYRDFREVIARKDIDAIVISTPDHWHVPLTLLGLQAGKHVFSEKPTLTIRQGRALVEAVRKSGRVFQWGIEDRSLIKYHKLVEWALNGAIGKVGRVHVCLPYYGSLQPYGLEKEAPVPQDMDWNLWLGPAPFHPYTPQRTDPRHWRRIFDYSGGSITDWGAHLVDTAQLVAGVEATGPVEIQGTGTIPEKMESNVPHVYDINYTYANGSVIRVQSGEAFIRCEGDKGWVGCRGWDNQLEASSPGILHTRYPAGTLGFMPLPPREQRNFLDCIRSGKPTTYFPEAGHRLFTTLHLGHLAVRSGQKLKWDPDQETLLSQVADDGIISRPARNWEKA